MFEAIFNAQIPPFIADLGLLFVAAFRLPIEKQFNAYWQGTHVAKDYKDNNELSHRPSNYWLKNHTFLQLSRRHSICLLREAMKHVLFHTNFLTLSVYFIFTTLEFLFLPTIAIIQFPQWRWTTNKLLWWRYNAEYININQNQDMKCCQ